MNKEKIFADGFSFSKREDAPDFVIGKVAIKVADALTFIKEHDSKGWVNLDIKQSKGGKYYMELDTWQPKIEEKKNELKREEVYAPSDLKEDLDEELPF